MTEQWLFCISATDLQMWQIVCTEKKKKKKLALALFPLCLQTLGAAEMGGIYGKSQGEMNHQAGPDAE